MVGPTYRDEVRGQKPQLSCNMEEEQLWDHNMPEVIISVHQFSYEKLQYDQSYLSKTRKKISNLHGCPIRIDMNIGLIASICLILPMQKDQEKLKKSLQ